MHKVQPQIQPITEYTHIPLGNITVLTLWNKGTTNVLYGFGDVQEVLKPGQTVSFEAGANTVFTAGSKLTVDFVPVGASDINYCSMQSNKLTQASRMFSDLTSK